MNIYGVNNYKSPYGSVAFQERSETQYKQIQETNKDKYDFYKKNKKTSNILLTLALIAGSIFAGYKGKDKIGKMLNGLKWYLGEGKAKFTNKFPNLSSGIEGFKNAGKTLLKPIKAAKDNLIKYFTKS